MYIYTHQFILKHKLDDFMDKNFIYIYLYMTKTH